MSDAFYKNLELQMKEMGQAYWACRSCLSFCNKMNTQIKEVDKRVDKLMGKLEENTAGLKKADEKIEEVRKAVGKVERKQEDSEKRIEENMAEEMRAREAIRRNIIVHGIPEPDSRIKTDKERSEADLVECDHIFKATGARIGRKDIRFCRRIGERGQEKRPLLVGMKTEIIKTELLDAASELRHTAYKTVSICPDQTRMQRQAEKKLLEKVEQKNREDLTDEDRSKNLKWMAVGKKGEKRITKGQAREERDYNVGDRGRNRQERRSSRERRWPSSERRRTNGDGRIREERYGEGRYREERYGGGRYGERGGDRRNGDWRRNSRERRRGDRETSKETSREKSKGTDRHGSRERSKEKSKEKSREASNSRMEQSGGEDNANKRGRGSGTDSEGEQAREPSKKTRQ